jgi:hypothetical protein
MRRLLCALFATRDEMLLRLAAIGTLVALALMLWQFFDPTVWPIMLAMSVAQGIGTVSFATFVYVIVRDVMRSRRVRRASGEPRVSEP